MSFLAFLICFALGVWADAKFDVWGRGIALWRRFQAWRRFRENKPDDRYPPEGQ